MIIFDVDGTLIDRNDEPRPEVLALFRAFVGLGEPVGIWSGGGVDYARRWAEKLELDQHCSFIGSKVNLMELLNRFDVRLFVDDRMEDPLAGVRVLKV